MPLRLKALELNGYKSFASKADFVFSEGISAIVGPNGSGKSNVVDGIRWVLGEQAYSLLRGKKTEDMIFAGSDLRPRAGMAQVTLTFDNSDGWLPIEFAEVAITRRAHRDGSNEYLLNGQRVRLKDLHELLAKCGLAERTYTIIGQGLIDNALALKAEERRALFEEAAGIGLYRDKREDALKKLDATQRNLERVLDILEEIRPRLGSLERQAKRAREFHTVKRELNEVLHVWYGYHWHRTLAELELTRSVADQAAATLDALQARQAAFDQQVSGLRARAADLRRQIAAARAEADARRTERESLARELAVADERLRSLVEQRSAVLAELEPLAAEQAQLEASADAARADLAERQAEAEARQSTLELAQSAVLDTESTRALLLQRDSDARTTLTRIEAELGALRDRQTQLRERASLLQTQHAEQQTTLEHLAAHEVACAQALAAATLTADARHAERADREADLRNADAAVRAAEAARLAATEHAMHARTGLESLRARHAILLQARAEVNGFAAGARQLIDSAFPVHGVLGELLQVPAEYETAISAALGAYADGVVIDHHGEAEQALNRLERGKAALLPIRSLNGTHKVTPPADPDVLGVAVDLLPLPDHLRPVVTSVLGNTVVVRDRAAARRVLTELPYYASAVTLAGEMFHAAGPVVGGRDAAPGVIEHARQLRDLEADLAAATTTLEAAQAKVAAATAQVAHAQAALAQARTAAQTAQIAEREALAARDAAALAAERSRRELELRREQARTLGAEAERDLATAEALETEITGRLSAREAAHANASAAALDLASYTPDDASALLARAQSDAALSAQALANAQARVADCERALQASQRARADRLARAERLEAEASTVRTAAEAIRERILALDTLSTEGPDLEPLQAELAQLEHEQTQLETGDTESRAALHGAEKANTDAQLRFARKQAELDTLRLRIEEDFGLVEVEYSDSATGPQPLPLDDLLHKLEARADLPEGIEETVNRRRNQMRRMGAINPEADREYTEVRDRHDFLTAQVSDLQTAQAQLRDVINEMDQIMEREFKRTLEEVGGHFTQIFATLFGGGSAKLLLSDPDNPNTSGVDISCKLPGKKPQGLSMLSGGERSLTACALVFALLKVSPTPFCVLDEVDAMLDEANVGRYRDMLNELGQATQFIIITHNRNTVQVAETVYGITMGADSASQMISLRLDGERIAAPAKHDFAAVA